MKRIFLTLPFLMMAMQSAFAFHTVNIYGPERGLTQGKVGHHSQYVLHLGVFRNQQNADNLRNKVAHLTHHEINEKYYRSQGKRVYSIFIGPFAKPEDVNLLSREILHA